MTDLMKFGDLITQAMLTLADPTSSSYIKGEMFGFLINRIVKKFLGIPEYTQTSFNSYFFNESQRKTLIHCADSLATMITRVDPISNADELYYVLAAICDGAAGDGPNMKSSFGQNCYLLGILDKIHKTTEPAANSGSQSDKSMLFRRILVVNGVLLSVKKRLEPKWPDAIWDNQKLAAK